MRSEISRTSETKPSHTSLLSYKTKIELLLNVITEIGLIPVCSDFIFEKYSIFSGRPEERAKALLKFYTDVEIKAIFDISSGDVALVTTFFNQLKHMGVFSKINGILLGTFTKMEENNFQPTVEDILINVLNDRQLPIAKTKDIGHGTDSKCIAIGKFMSLY